MDTGAALGGTGLFISLVGIIYSAINHKHIKSNCCGKNIEFSIDIDSTTDKNPAKNDNTSGNEKKDDTHVVEKENNTEIPEKLFKSTKFKVHPINL
jgi:hypothetical protein